MKRRELLLSAGAAGLARPALAQQSSARVLRFVPQADLANPDPVWTTATVAYNHGFMIWDTPYGLDGNYAPQPQMMVGHELSDDRLTWRFTLRDGLLFHDGEKVRAIDVVASINRWGKRRPMGQLLLERAEEIKALDDSRMEIRLKRPYPLMLNALADYLFVMPERIAQTDAYRQITEYVGSGPYRFLRDEWRPGSRAAYARHERYLPRAEAPDHLSGGKVVNFDRVEWIVMPDPATAGNALIAGEVDWVEQPLPDLLPTIRRSRNARVLVNDRIGAIAMMAINHLHPPFDNPKLLRALLSAIDQQQFMEAAFGQERELFRTGVGVFTAGLPMANDAGMEALNAPRDLAAARRAVQESGYRGERVVLMAPSDQANLQAYAQVMRATMSAIGINVDYVSTDWGTLIQRRSSREPVERGGWSAFCTSYSGLSVMDPVVHQPLRGNGLQGWFGWPTDAPMEAMRDEWLEAPDLAAQQAIAQRMQILAFQNVPFLPLGQFYFATAVSTRLSDFVRWPTPLFWGLRKS
jgi:peptide/nickel transport system substrate-binding protein